MTMFEMKVEGGRRVVADRYAGKCVHDVSLKQPCEACRLMLEPPKFQERIETKKPTATRLSRL